MDDFAYGVASNHLSNMEKQNKVGGLLDLGKNKYSGGFSSSTSNL